MACTYEVRKDGATVWTDTTDEYQGAGHFPAEHRARPASGVVELVVDGETIAVMEPLDIDAFLAGVRQNIEGTIVATVDDATAEVG